MSLPIKIKVFNFLNRIVKIKEPVNYSEDIIKYDTDNKFPQNLINYIRESGTATRCVDELGRYSFAEGFVKETTAKMKFNETQNGNDIVEELLQQSIYFEGNALHISRKTDGTIDSVRVVPFENIRRAKNYLIYNPTLSSDKYDQSKDKKHPYFKGVKLTPEELAEVSAFGEDAGEILYIINKRPGTYIYPIPGYYASISDIETDAELSKYELETVNNSFLPSGILTIIGNINNEVKDDEDSTEWDEYQEQLEAFTGNVKNEKGESGRNKLLVLQAETKEQVPNYQALTNEAILNASETATKRIEGKVCRAFGVPPFIVGIGGTVGFATNIISDNITLFNNRVLKIQNLATKGLKLCFPEMDFTLTQLTPIKYLAPEVLKTLSETELRAIGGYAPKEEVKNV